MKKPLWFRAKNYGWGWYPCSWQGWVILLLYVAVLSNFNRLDVVSQSNNDTLRPFVIQTIGMTILLIIICYKTGEKPEWRWGGKKTKLSS